MIAVETNVLVYAHRSESPFHAPARAAVRLLAEGARRWAIPWPCIHEFLGVVTRPRVYDPPTPMPIALAQMDAWMESPALALLSEDVAYWPSLRDVLSASGVAGAKVHDARIAALCLRHGVSELWSADRDFGRFPALRVRNPLVG